MKDQKSYLAKRKKEIESKFNEHVEVLKKLQADEKKVIDHLTVLRGAFAELVNQEKEIEGSEKTGKKKK